MRSLIDMAADRGAFIDQSQSLNLFIESPNIGQLSSMYFYAWKKGLKTTYYLRSRPATRIAKTTVETRQRRRAAAACRRDADARGRRLLAREPREPARPASERRRARPARLLDPGMCLTLRPDGVPGVLRDVPRRDQEHLDGRGGRLLDRRRRPAQQDDATPSATSSSASSPSSPPATRSSPTTWCSTSTSTSTRPRRACTCRASSTRRRCTSSST